MKVARQKNNEIFLNKFLKIFADNLTFFFQPYNIVRSYRLLFFNLARR